MSSVDDLSEGEQVHSETNRAKRIETGSHTYTYTTATSGPGLPSGLQPHHHFASLKSQVDFSANNFASTRKCIGLLLVSLATCNVRHFSHLYTFTFFYIYLTNYLISSLTKLLTSGDILSTRWLFIFVGQQ